MKLNVLKMRFIPRSGVLALLSFAPLFAANPPAPYGPVPSDQQVNWLRMEWYGFVHFGLNTYTGKEWGYGDEPASLFNPSHFNAQAIAKTFRKAGMTGLIYTAKHHDGWCSWPTKSTKHNITASPWKGGKGDVVKEFSKACRREGIRFGVYISPWDRNCAEYGRPGYLPVYRKQIQELLSHYGPIFEIWFDGANGGDGYYGGKRERRKLAASADEYYRFAEIVKLIRRLQPNCIIWGAEGHGDAQWGGSESGEVKYPVWNISGAKNDKWISLEGDTPINRAGWFWHPGQESRVKSPEKLMDVYFKSVGRGANLILNVAPNRNGELDAADVKSLLEFGENRRRLLACDFARGASVKASEIRGGDPRFDGEKAVDGDIETYWCPNDGSTTGSLELTLPKPATFDVVRLREQIRLGQRVEKFRIEAWLNGQWALVYEEGQSVGNQVLCRLEKPIETDRIRVQITQSKACPCISEISLLRMPVQMPAPKISRQGDTVAISKAEPYILRYTTNGENPHSESPQYGGEFDFRASGVIKAAYENPKDRAMGPVAILELGLSKARWWGSFPEEKLAIDDDPSTVWQSEESPASLSIELDKTERLAAFSYLPRQDGNLRGMTDRYSLSVSLDGKTWKKVSEGEFSNLRANPIEQKYEFAPVEARYVRFTSTRAIEGTGASVAEFNLYPPSVPREPHKLNVKKQQ